MFVEINNQLVPFFIEEIAPLGVHKYVLRFSEIKSYEDACKLTTCEIYFPGELLPELSDHHFFSHQVIGFKVIDKKQGLLGVVKEMKIGSSQYILSIYKDEKGILLPVVDQFILSVDKSKAEIIVQIPEGLLDLNS